MRNKEIMKEDIMMKNEIMKEESILIDIATNPTVRNKKFNSKELNSKFMNRRATPLEILEEIRSGTAICNSKLASGSDGISYRKEDNFISCQLIGIDIDNDLKDENGNKSVKKGSSYISLEDAKKNEFLKENCYLIYTTASHTIEWHKLRFVFILPDPETDPDRVKLITKALTKKFGGDPATSSATQIFFGAEECSFEVFNKILTNDVVEDIIADYSTSNSIEYKRISEDKDINGYNFTIEEADEIVKFILKDGHVPNSIWWKIPTILKAYCGFTDDEIIELVGKYVTDVGDIRQKLYYADKYCYDMTIGTLIFHAKKNGYQLPQKLLDTQKDIKFWSYYNYTENEGTKYEKSNIIFDLEYRLLTKYLINNLFKVIILGDETYYVHINNNILSYVNDRHIRTYVRNYLEDYGYYSDIDEKNRLEEKFSRSGDSIYKAIYSGLPDSKEEILNLILKDNKDETYITFNNSVLKITKDSKQQLAYDEIGHYVWKSSLLKRNYNASDQNTSEFQKFLKFVCTSRDENENLKFNADKYNSIITCYGYLLCNYKDPSKHVAVILTDESLFDSNQGGTGKSLFTRALSEMRETLTLDGKNLNLDSPFWLMNVKPSTEIINIDDADEKIKFDKFFTMITGDMSIEQKNKDRFVIPFKDSPKFCFTSNWVLKGSGDSHDRRKLEIEFSNYFNSEHTPKDEFGHLLYDDWTEDEWNRFYDFSIECIQNYLNNGIMHYDQMNLPYKKLESNTTEEFADFVVNEIQLDKIYDYKINLELYNNRSNSTISPTKFTQMLKEYSKYKKCYFDKARNRQNNQSCFLFHSEKRKNIKFHKKEKRRNRK
jgi:uncharacterized protein DUF5906